MSHPSQNLCLDPFSRAHADSSFHAVVRCKMGIVLTALTIITLMGSSVSAFAQITSPISSQAGISSLIQYVRFDSADVMIGDTATVSLTTDSVSAEDPMHSFQFDLTLPSHVTYLGFDLNNSLSRGGFLVANRVEDTLKVAFAGYEGAYGNDLLARFRFTADSSGRVILTPRNVKLNATQIDSVVSGAITVTMPLPSGVILEAPSDSAVDMTVPVRLIWKKGPFISTYQVQVSADGFENVQIDTVTADTSLTLASLAPGTSYAWTVTGTNEMGSGPASATWTFTTLAAPLASPTLLTPTNGQIGVARKTEFTWGAVAGSAGYQIQIAADQNFSSLELDSVGVQDTVFAPAATLAQETVYFWRVKALADNALRNSEWASPWAFTTGVATSTEGDGFGDTGGSRGADLPTEFALEQNFPNPFNPSTSIRFGLPAVTQHISLRIHDMLGRQVAILIDGTTLSAGWHTIEFDAASLPSGIYTYTLQTPEILISRPMTLVK